MESSSRSSSSVIHRGNLMYVEAVLHGGAPWGFTLKGGLEHGETLIISKVEDGGKADQLQHPLQPGDQIVIINQVELSGTRQEAISLVKGSYKTLQLIVSRECVLDPCCSQPATSPSVGHSLSQEHAQERQGHVGGVKLRIKDRRGEPVSRPHSWHSTKLGEGVQDPAMMEMSQGGMAVPWHQTYHSSASTTDLSAYSTGLLRRSPDQYSSRGSMESLDHGHPAYSSCHQLSSSKSSNSIDHLHNKRDSAYSSFSNSSSIPEYPVAGPSFAKERSCSMDSMLSQRAPEGLRQADVRYVRTVYDPQQGISQEHEVTSARLLRNNEGRGHADLRGGALGGPLHHSSSGGGSGCSSASTRNSFGCLWGQANSQDSSESLKGVPAPPLRSDSYAAIKNHERPNSWSSLEQTRSSRGLQKGFWHHSSGSVSSMKSSLMAEGQLHTLEEKSPESSPTTKPKQNCTPPSQPVRFMLPTGIYPVPQPEPHYAQVPTCYPASGSMYPALAMEGMCSPHRDHNREVNVDGTMSENVNQSNTFSKPPTFPKPKEVAHHDRRRHEDSDGSCGHYRHNLKSGVDVLQVQNQDSGYRPMVQDISQERRDPYTRVKQRAEKQHNLQAFENPSSEDLAKPAAWSHCLEANQLQKDFLSHAVQDGVERLQESNRRYSVPASHRDGPGSAYAQKSDGLSHLSPSHHSDSEMLQQRQQEHPLTQLENALVQVQRSAGPQAAPVHRRSCSEGPETDAMHLSVLEKVSRFEQREQRMMQGQSYVNRNNVGPGPIRPNYPRSTKMPCSCSDEICHRAELRDAISRTQNYNTEERRTMNHEDSEPQQFSPAPPMCGNREPPLRNLHGSTMAIQRSKSTYQLGEDSDKKFFRKEDFEISGTIQDQSFNRTYRDSIKDAQSKVLRSTSFRRKDLRASPSVPSKHLSLERKPPKTSPKPSVTSPHTPKERHIVAPEIERNSPPPLPKVPAVGPPVTRIGGRKRLTLEQKSRSYSEPENIHEVGLSDCDLSQKVVFQQVFFPETSVADKCKLFEMAATESTGPGLSISRPKLKQMQQDALSDYIERKTGRRPAGIARPASAYVRPSSSDSQSLSSSSSFASLQEPGFSWPSRPECQVVTTRVSPAPPVNSKSTMHPNSAVLHLQPSGGNSASIHKQQVMMHEICASEGGRKISALESYFVPHQYKLHSQHDDKKFQDIAPSRDSGKYASAEDLLDPSEEKWAVPKPKHHRSQSSPFVEKFSKDLITEDQTAFKTSSKQCSLSTQTGNRSENPETKEDSYLDKAERNVLKEGRPQTCTPAVRRDRHRQPERQRAHSSTGLAASVGLPCSFCPPPSTTELDWQASEGLHQAGPDTLATDTFLRQDSRLGTQGQAPLSGAMRSGSANGSTPERAPKDVPKDKPSSRTAIMPKNDISLCFSGSQVLQAEASCDAVSQGGARPLLSLHISESDIRTCHSSSFSKGDDANFQTDPTTPSLPSPPVRETDITEDFPLHTPECSPTGDGPSVNTQNATALTKYLSRLSTAQVSCNAPSVPPVSPGVAEVEASSAAGVHEQESQSSSAVCPEQDGVEENPVLCRRRRSPQELRVEALARILVSKDKSLTPILSTWSVKSTVDLMEEVFPSEILSPKQQRKSGWPQERWQEEEMWLQAENKGMVTDLDEAEADLHQKKTQLMEALVLSIAALREEKEGLAEEQRRFIMLESHIEALIQERCKPNECDKYHMFIGDLDKIVNLLLSLCGRLARVENALTSLDGQRTEDSDREKASLELKRRQLCGQREDARELKKNLDRRERVVLDILGAYLSGQQLSDYQHFVRMKPALLIRHRCLDDLIKQGEEQLRCLGEGLPSGDHGPTEADRAGAALPASSPARSTAVTSL